MSWFKSSGDTEPVLSPHYFSMSSPLIILGALALLPCLQFVGALLILFVKGFALGFSGLSFDIGHLQNQLPEALVGAQWFVTLVGIPLLIGILYVARQRGTPYLFTRLPQPRLLLSIPLLAVGGVGLTMLYMLVVGLLASHSPYWASQLSQYHHLMGQVVQGMNPLQAMLIYALLIPILEELLFRGLILSELKLFMHPYLALTVTALFFGVLHAQVVQSIYATGLGILIGLIYVWSESIWASILFHMIFNFFGGVLPALFHIQKGQVKTVAEWVYLILCLLFLLISVPVLIWVARVARPAKTVARYSPAWKAQMAATPVPEVEAPASSLEVAAEPGILETPEDPPTEA